MKVEPSFKYCMTNTKVEITKEEIAHLLRLEILRENDDFWGTSELTISGNNHDVDVMARLIARLFFDSDATRNVIDGSSEIIKKRINDIL